jgi:hypothetical protein
VRPARRQQHQHHPDTEGQLVTESYPVPLDRVYRVGRSIQWVSTNFDQIADFWTGIELPKPRIRDGHLGVWCNPRPRRCGYRPCHHGDWIEYFKGRVTITKSAVYHRRLELSELSKHRSVLTVRVVEPEPKL